MFSGEYSAASGIQIRRLRKKKGWSKEQSADEACIYRTYSAILSAAP
jgi:transcriptional regulator with XRE-family HTH domain